MKKLILSAFILTAYPATAQQGVTPPGINIAEHVPQSPTVAGLSKYFDVPVNMNTGQPGISIPIYTIKSGNITVPVTLSYPTLQQISPKLLNFVFFKLFFR
jgi:hypothetical protein